MFKIINNIAPSYLSVNITPIIESHKYNTRSSSHSSHAGKSFHVTGIKQWNNLEPSLKLTCQFLNLKKKFTNQSITILIKILLLRFQTLVFSYNLYLSAIFWYFHTVLYNNNCIFVNVYDC